MVQTRLLFGTFILFLLLGYPVRQIRADSDLSSDNRLMQGMDILKIDPEPVPSDLGLATAQGKIHRLSEYKGRIVLLNFWGTWCRECLEEMPALEKLHRAYVNKGLVILGINLEDSAEQVQRFYHRFGITYTTLLDKTGDVGRAFFIQAVPTGFIVNKEGLIVGVAIGSKDWDSKASRDLFEFLLE